MSVLFSYNLNNISQHVVDNNSKLNIKEILENPCNDNNKNVLNSLHINHKSYQYNNKEYDIFNYDKEYLTEDTTTTIGLFRSIILYNNKIISFAPPKSIKDDKYTNTYKETDSVAEEFIDGTMIQLFWDGNNWEIATRRSIGGEVYYYRTGRLDEDKTFKEMYEDVVNSFESRNNWLDRLDKSLCYSFVLQHPSNRIVSPIITPLLWLVAVYRIDNNTYNVDRLFIDEDIKNNLPKEIKYPEQYNFTSYNELRNNLASSITPYYILGVMIFNKNNGLRTKYRNPNYELVRKLRGNDPKLQFRYLVLRQNNQVSDYLKFIPEHKDLFQLYRTQIHIFTDTLYKLYCECFIHKNIILKNCPFEFKVHIYTLHQKYLNNEFSSNITHDNYKSSVKSRKSITKYDVITYVNNLAPAKLMFSLNYPFRQKYYDDVYKINNQ